MELHIKIEGERLVITITEQAKECCTASLSLQELQKAMNDAGKSRYKISVNNK